MARIVRSLDVPYPAQQMYGIVDRIEDYPQFLPWCLATSVERSPGGRVAAEMKVGKGRLRHTFATQNTHDPDKLEISIRLARGPFSDLHGNWRFIERPGGCRIDFLIEYEFATRALDRLLSPLFAAAYGRMVDSFAERAHELHACRA